MNRNTLFGTTLENLDPATLVGNEYEKCVEDLCYDNTSKLRDYVSNLKRIDADIDEKKREKRYFQLNDDEFIKKWSRNMKGMDKCVTKAEKRPQKLYSNHITKPERMQKENHQCYHDNTESYENYAKILKKHIIRDMGPTRIKLPNSGREIPKNVCHTFGAEICDYLLSSGPRQLEKESEEENEVVNKQEKTKLKEPMKISEYEMLGGILRSNVLPGYTINLDQSESGPHYASSYRGWDTFSSRDKSIPVQYRMKKDEVSKWAMADVVEKRIFKEWRIRQEEQMANKKQPAA